MYAVKLTVVAMLAAVVLGVSGDVEAQTKGKTKHRAFAVNRGAKVTVVAASSPAADAGLEKGDVITHVDGTPITSTTHLTNTLAGKSNVTMTVVNVRDGSTISLTAYPINGKLGINVEIVDLDEAPAPDTTTHYSQKKQVQQKSKTIQKKK